MKNSEHSLYEDGVDSTAYSWLFPGYKFTLLQTLSTTAPALVTQTVGHSTFQKLRRLL